MTTHNIEYDCECEDCKGSGLYIGMAERPGAAVLCKTCDGTGKHHVSIRYKDFEGKRRRTGVKRVFQANPGIAVGPGKSNGGLSYDDWLDGKKFTAGTEMRKFTCPAWWYQTADSSKKPNWDECVGIGRFSDCSCFSDKEACWKRWDSEQKKGKT